jgi:hypothetical protein
MITRIQLKQFVMTVLDLHRDNFIQLLNNPEFQVSNLDQQERAVEHVTLLFKKELDDYIDSFVETNN